MPDEGPTPKTPRTERPRTPRVDRPTVQEEVNQEDMAGRITALENMAVTHATFLQQIYDDVANMKKSGSQLTAKIVSLDEYSQNIDKRVTAIRDEAEAFYKQTGQSVMGRIEQLERQLQLLIQQQQRPQPPQQQQQGQDFKPPGFPAAQNYNIGSPPGNAGPPQANDATRTRYFNDDVNTAFRQDRQPFQQAFGAQPQGRGFAEPKDAMAVFRIHRKDCDLKKFSGRMSDFKMWKKRFIDHCTSSTGKWKEIFKMCEEADGAITRAYLESLHIGSGYSAWALAEDLENFIVKYLSDDIYERREAWCGGEDGNGFELYRNLFREFEGGSTLVRMGGRKLLNNYGRPQKGDDVLKHFEDWQILLAKYGADLMHNPEECFYRALEVIPNEYEDEVVMKPEIKTMGDIKEFVSRKTTHHKHLAQQRALIQSRNRRSHVSELSTKHDDMSVDNIVAKTIAAVQKANFGPKAHDKPRPKSPGPTAGKFWFKPDCWWCGADGHQKRDCEKYKKMLADNNGKRPKGLKGAFEKAREAWNKEHGRDRDGRSKSPRPLKPLMSDDDDSDSDDSHSDLIAPMGSMMCADVAKTNVFSLRCIPCDDTFDEYEPNTQQLDAADDLEEPERLRWQRENDAIYARMDAERPTIWCCGPIDASVKERVVDDVDEIYQIFALPTDNPTPHFAVPDDDGLEKGEVYALMDSGAGCHAADAEKDFPKHKKRKGKQIRKCVLADGTPLESDEVVDVRVDIEGENHMIEFDDLPVECPIISVKKIVHKGNKVVFQEKGGVHLECGDAKETPLH